MDNKIKFISRIIAASFILVFALANVAFAVEGAGPTSLDDIDTIIETIVDWFQGIVLLIGIMMIVWAGLMWMIAGGNDEKLDKARKMLIWGLVGIAVALFAGVAETFITNLID